MSQESLRTHIQIIAWLNIILGALSLIGGAIAFMMLSGLGLAAASEGSRTTPDAGILGLFFGGFGVLIASVCLLSGLPGVIVGAGLLRYEPWARIGCIILSILHLVNATTWGFSTVLGIYSLVILFTPECEKLFRRHSA